MENKVISKGVVLSLLMLLLMLRLNSAEVEQNRRGAYYGVVDSIRSFLSQPLTTSYWNSIKTFTTKTQAYFFPPNLDFKSSKEEAPVEDGAGAVSKSFKKGKEMVEESAEVAATVTGEALHKTKDKIKNTFYASNNKKHDHQNEL
ncbi:hypothetical protein ACFE04_031653 [Oxalis oulophora]